MGAGTNPKKILIVEDDPGFRSLTQDYLSNQGFSVNTAATGAEALWALSQDKPDLIILDLMMPEMSGEHVCKLIKSDPALSEIIVFILSAKKDLATKIACLEMGAEEYLLKPIDLSELTARVRRFLKFADHTKQTFSDERTVTIGLVERKRDPDVSTKPSVAIPVSVHAVEKSSYGSYRVERLVGLGGMGHVYKAYDEQLDRFVALKVLSKQWTDSAEFVQRFRREAKLIAAVTHPGIAQIYSLGEDQGQYYFALLWCPGGSLRDLIRHQTKIGFMKAVDIVLQCTRALAAAWQKGVVHRDVKPSNIMFDENQQIKLVDFGIAHSDQMSSQITVAQEILGSPAYMAPEQGRGERVDHRADIYALGMTFFQMLSGELPFSAQSPVEWMVKNATEPFPAYQKVKSMIPQKAYQIIQKMTRKDPAARYQTYAELIEDLQVVEQGLFRECQLKVPSAKDISSAPALQGNQLFHGLAEIAKKEESGILKTSWGPLEKRFLISHGDLVLYESPQNEENVWKKLVEKGILDPQQMSVQDKNLEETLNRLLFMQALSLDDFTLCYRKLMNDAFLEVFHWPVVELTFYKADITQDSFCKSSLNSLLMEGVRNYIDFESIRHDVPRNQFIVQTAQFDQIFSKLELPVTESFLASRIEGESITIEVLQLLTGFPVEQITRFIYALKGFDAITYRSQERKPRQREHRVGETISPEVTPPPAKTISHAAENYYKLAEQAYARRDYWSTEHLCKLASDLDPEEARYYHLIALAISQQGGSAYRVEDAFRKAIRFDPFNVGYRIDLADYLKTCGSIETAIQECRQAVKISPENPKAISLLHSLEKQI